MPHISVVIPVYQGEHFLDELYRRLKISLEILTQDFEILMIEDAGKDRSWEMIVNLSKKDPRVKGIQFSRNFGQHDAITAGIDHSTGDWTVVMDCDLQDRPEEIPRLYARTQEGFDIVLAKRRKRKDFWFKILCSHLFYKMLSQLSGLSYDEQVGNFRVISRRVVENLRLFREQLRFFPALVTWLGFPTSSIEIQHDERIRGQSAYTFRKRLSLAASAIISYSDKPLRLCIKFGFVISILAFIYGSYVVFRALVHHIPIPGWGSLISSLYFIGGIIITLLGVIGVYLGKTFDETKKRPLYVILNRTFDDRKIAS